MFLFRCKQWGKKILDFLFPVSCVGCATSGTLLCSPCLDSVPPRLYSARLSSGMEAMAGCGYTHLVIQKAITRAKYYHSPQLFTTLTLHLLPAFVPLLQQKAVLVPVPLHKMRKQSRGYNQSEYIANAVADNAKHLTVCPMVVRIKNTPHQARLSREKRKKNIENAFVLDIKQSKKIAKNTPIIIVDDVISTGSTVMEIEKILKKEGFTCVSAVCLARGGGKRK